MREIKFRGKRIDNGEWVYGSHRLFKNGLGDRHFIIDYNEQINGGIEYEVDTSTVGQYTGLKDKNGKEIYEGDILRKADCFIGYVKYCAPLFYRVPLDKWSIEHGVEETVVNCGAFVTSEVIGNIHDNPDLLEVTE